MAECKNCKGEVSDINSTCGRCKYPLKGTEQEQAAFIAKQVMQKSNVEWSIKSLGNSQKVLFGLAVFYAIVPNLTILNDGVTLALIFNLFNAAIFAGFGFLVFKKPKLALGVPLIIVSAYYVLLISIDPMLFMNGSIWKMIVLIGLTYGLVNVFKSDKILKENPYLASVLGYNKVSERR